MNRIVKNLWRDALSSGDYKQTAGTLVEKTPSGEPGHCCLGVLTDLYCKAGLPDVTYNPAEHTFVVKDKPGSTRYGMPPQKVYEWAGLDEDEAGILAQMNDAGATFNAIDVYIKWHL